MAKQPISHAGNKYPIYYNVSQVNAYSNSPVRVQVPASIMEDNTQVILDKSSDYYVAIARCTIPTNGIPLIIVPVETNQPLINKTLYKITFKLQTGVTGSGLPIYNEAFTVTSYVPFLTQFPALSVRPPLINQDFSNLYYFIYDIEQMLLMFNNAIQQIFSTFITGLGDPNFSAAYFPYLTFDYNTRSFSINMTANVVNGGGTHVYFDQQSAPPTPQFPHFAMLMDDLSIDLFGIGGYDVSTLTEVQLMCFNKYDNVTTKVIGGDTQTIYKMTASQSSLNMWQSINRIIITIPHGLSTVLEYSSVPSAIQNAATSNSINKPSIPILTDLEFDVDEFAANRNFIQFTSSNISQQRLISVTGDKFQSFILSVYWVDNFGIQRELFLPTGIPLTLKLAWYPKTTSLI